ncbi:ankyrin repeat domain-containing protein [Ascidiimonas aurantiaca]|uniref:ankyrin repeat domain-containing protein n=1 Tax=Ascidiimonas aurantiaca TaxID=1685432 RepID=UPI0030EBC683
MKIVNIAIIALIFLLTGASVIAQENVFLARDYWKSGPSLQQVKNDMALGNDPTQLNQNAFDAVCWALIEKADNEIVKFLLEQDGNGVNKLTHDGRTYIFWAAYKNNMEIMKYLVSKGAKTDIIDSHGYSLLNFTAVSGQQDRELYDFIIALGGNPVTEKNHDGANALLLVAPFLKDEALINYFTAKGVDLHSKDDNGNGIFNYAAKMGNISFLNLLIEKGVDYKTPNKKGGNAFIFASKGTRSTSNTLETYKYLESLGLEPNVVNNDGVTPMHAIAYKNKDLAIFNYFIEKGVDINIPDSNGNNAFMNAAYSNDLEIVAFLANHVSDVNLTNKKGQTALTLATQSNSPEVVKFLLDKNADIHTKDNDGNTLAHYVINGYSDENAEAFDQKLALLQKSGLNMNETQADAQTLWHLSVKKNNLSLLKRIKQFDVPINTKNKEGLTPLHLAAMKATNIDILKFLLNNGASKEVKTDFDESVYDLALENELLQKQQTELNFLR